MAHLLPTPAARDHKGRDLPTRDGGPGLPTVARLLPTPAVNDMGSHYTPEAWDDWTAKMADQFGNNGHGRSLSIEARRGHNPYRAAIARWERVLGRAAPPLRWHDHLNPFFVEWMMGYDDGYICRVPGINRSTAIRALGNACVPQQAETAVRRLLQPW
jgi:hypothetical protein